MQQQVIPFYYSSEYNRVTTIRTMKDSEDKVWFCAKDICDILEIKNVTQALESLDEDELSMFNIGNLSPKGGNPNINFVNESGLYTLIFKSHKPEARKFRKWVTNEVLPTLREYGFYGNREQIRNIVHEELLGTVREVVHDEISSVLRTLQPETPKKPILIRELGAMLRQYGISCSQKSLFAWFRQEGYLSRDNIPTQLASEFFSAKKRLIQTKDGITTQITPLLTPNGANHFFEGFTSGRFSLI